MRLKIYLFIGLLIAASAVGFALQNNEIIAVHILKWQWQTSVAFLILVCVLIGVVFGWLISLPGFVQSVLEKLGLKFKVKNLENKLKKNEAVVQKTQEKFESPKINETEENKLGTE